jgi:lysylphosphatidylglycerol synthetase-like protein (DUF2156 family)
MADELVLDLPVGARVLVFADLRLGAAATDASLRASEEMARAVESWSGPGAVVVAGNLFDFGHPEQADIEGAFSAHSVLAAALKAFAAGQGRRTVVLPGRRDAWLSWSPSASATLAEAVGAQVAPAVVLEMRTNIGLRRVRVEPGEHGYSAGAAPSFLSPRGSQRLADVVPGVWRGSTSGWLADMAELDDPAAASRFVASRLVYRQLGRRLWLLGIPVLVALLVLRLPLALLRPARLVSGVVLSTTLAVAALELVVLAALAAMSLRQVWLAFSGKARGPRDLNEGARALSRELVRAGWAGFVTGGTCRAELSPQVGGFYANPGCCTAVVTETAPRFGGLGLPSPFMAFHQVGWVELEVGNELHARLLHGELAFAGATIAERFLVRQGCWGRAKARTQRVMPSPVVVASYPYGPAWPAAPNYRAPHRRVRRLAALFVSVAGLLSLVSSLSTPLRDHLTVLRRFVPLVVPQAAGALSVLAGIALLVLAAGIRRGQWRAYLVCQATLVVAAILHLVRAVDVLNAVVALAVVAFLWIKRASFRAASDTPPLWRGLTTLAGIAAVAIVAGALALEGTSRWSAVIHHRTGVIGLKQAFLATVERMGGIRHVLLPHRLDSFFSPAMFAVTAGLVLVAAWTVFRPVVARWPRPSGGLERAREVVRRCGSGTLDYFALRSDKQFFFWGGTVVAYAVYSGTCLVSPDPVGPPAEREAAWRAFREFADSRGWASAVLGASEDWLPVYRSTGMRDLYLGDEGVVRTDRFALEGGKAKGLRQAVNRVARYGYTVSFHDPARIEPALAAELAEVMTRSRRGGVERGFSMTLGRVFDPRDEGLLLAVVRGPGQAQQGPGGLGQSGARPGPAVAFCQYVPAPAIAGYSLDLMRRDNGEHPNGLIDFAIVETIVYLREHGYKGLGLNFATMRAVLAGETGDGLSQRVQAWLLRRMSGSMQIESLWRFNAKFDPEWQPRYAVYDAPEHALPTALAVARAESFWELPLIGRFLVPSAQRQAEAAGVGGAPEASAPL